MSNGSCTCADKIKHSSLRNSSNGFSFRTWYLLWQNWCFRRSWGWYRDKRDLSHRVSIMGISFEYSFLSLLGVCLHVHEFVTCVLLRYPREEGEKVAPPLSIVLTEFHILILFKDRWVSSCRNVFHCCVYLMSFIHGFPQAESHVFLEQATHLWWPLYWC